MTDDAGSALESGDDGVGKDLILEAGAAGLPQQKGEGGLRQEDLRSRLFRANPQDFPHTAAKRRRWLVGEVERLAHRDTVHRVPFG